MPVQQVGALTHHRDLNSGVLAHIGLQQHRRGLDLRPVARQPHSDDAFGITRQSWRYPGGDQAIPFFRYPDQSLLGPEQDYVPPVQPATASEASLRSNYVLGQDAYGASTELSLRASTFPVPDLAVGRLVETAAEASGMIDAYLATTGGVVATPTTSLVTGYDFLEDAANAVQGHLTAGTGRPGDSLITPYNVAPTAGWTASQLKSALFGARHDLIFLAGHFSANNALAADFTTTVNSTDLAASPGYSGP